jgi:hypothetical protein
MTFERGQNPIKAMSIGKYSVEPKTVRCRKNLYSSIYKKLAFTKGVKYRILSKNSAINCVYYNIEDTFGLSISFLDTVKINNTFIHRTFNDFFELIYEI